MTTGSMTTMEAPRRIGVGVTFGPTGDLDGVLQAARLADELGLDAVGFWDHYHALRPEWGAVLGWSVYGALAATTARIRLTPMVLCWPNHLPGVLAKESSMLQFMSGGRFELGIGAGDFPEEFRAWGVPFPSASERLAGLSETVAALKQVWEGRVVTLAGEHLHLRDACCAPPPVAPPRVVAGAGASRRAVDAMLPWADELNVYGRDDIVAYARERIVDAERPVALSVFAERSDAGLPQSLADDLAHWREQGASRYFLTIGFADDLEDGVRRLADAARTVNYD